MSNSNYLIVLNNELDINNVYYDNRRLPNDLQDSKLCDSDYYWFLNNEINVNQLFNSDIEYDSYPLSTPVNYREVDALEAITRYKNKY